MLRDEAEEEINKIFISDNTIHRRIKDASVYIEENVRS